MSDAQIAKVKDDAYKTGYMAGMVAAFQMAARRIKERSNELRKKSGPGGRDGLPPGTKATVDPKTLS